MSFYIDLSEFLTNPIRTGIQRIAGEMCSYLPRGSAVPVRLDSDHYVALPPALIDAIGKYFKSSGEIEIAEIRRLGGIENGRPIQISQHDTVLVPEVFDNPYRVDFFRKMSEAELQRCRFIIYDLLPLTHPEYFVPEGLLPIWRYYRILRSAFDCGFISEYTRDAYYHRLKRTEPRNGVVLPLGCDALGPRIDRPSLNRPLTFSVLGTIEPRKNHALILEAFEPLLRQTQGLNLWFIGKMGWVDPEFAQKIHALTSDKNSGFRFFSASGDGAIRSYIEQSRATIYVSVAEGYGLPPVESLWLGTPVIASNMIPSLTRLGSAGIHYVDPLNADNLRRAVLAFVDDVYAKQKTAECMHLDLPTWSSFTQEVLRWCGQALNAG